jgi:ribose transport system permease protein
MLAGGINLSVGATVSLGAVVAATTMGTSLGIAGGIGAVILVGLVVGLVTGVIAVQLRLPAIIVTLAGSFIIGGIALLVLPRPGGSVPAGLSDWLAGDSPVAFGLLLAILGAWKLYAATPLGLGLYAAGENPLGAFRSGVAVNAALIAAYGIGGILTALAGLFVAAQTGSGDPVIGQAFTLNSIAAAVLGGVGFAGGQGTMRGAVLGSLLLTVMINVMFFLGLPPVAQYLAQGLIIVGAVALPTVADRWSSRARRRTP